MQNHSNSYDLVISGGRVLDPTNNIDAKLDIAVSKGKIAAVEANIGTTNTERVVEAKGLVVTPGLIDLHTHASAGMRKPFNEEFLVTPDTAGVSAGVTTIVDAGSTGALNVGGLVNYVEPEAKTRVLALINIGSMGVANLPEVKSIDDINHDAAVDAIQSSAIVVGVKARMVTPGITALGINLPKAAKAIATETGTLMMVHVGDIAGQDESAPEITSTLLTEIMTKGDVVTHTLSGEIGSLLAEGTLIPEAMQARENGVYFDIGVGGGNFSFDSARKIIDAGFIPDTISSDITAASRFAGPVFSLTECMGKVMTLGITFEQAIEMTTSKPAHILGMASELGSLSIGSNADISILDLVNGDFAFHARSGPDGKGTEAIRPVMSVRDGLPMPLDHGPRPWGWLPTSSR